jgi:hypothetical protein
MRGAADALQGDLAHALEQMEPSYEATLGYGFLGVLPGAILADALASADRNEEALPSGAVRSCRHVVAGGLHCHSPSKSMAW